MKTVLRNDKGEITHLRVGNNFLPKKEAERLQLIESIAADILKVLREKTELDPCSLTEWELINLISKPMKEKLVNIL